MLDIVRPRLATASRTVLASALGALLGLGLLGGGLEVAPRIGLAAQGPAGPPRRPPIMPPSVPLGAPEEWALWSYFEKINLLWGQDWTTVAIWLEDLLQRYPDNPIVLDKLYAAYVEDGRELSASGSTAEARRRFQRAAELDPSRGIAEQWLDELDAAP